MSSRWRTLLACLATVVVLAPLAWLWETSLLPDEYSVMDMGYVDQGVGSESGPSMSHAGLHTKGISVVELTADPKRQPDVMVHLRAEKREFALTSGKEFDGYSLNGESPGPVIEAEQGQLVQVRLDNVSVPDGVTLHWHGLDVPNAMDGVAGVTQNAVQVGESFTYRFVAEQVGSYWYHSHQVSHEQVRRGLLGGLVVTPKGGVSADVDVPALVHLYDGVRTVNGEAGDVPVKAGPGETVWVRVANTDNGPMPVWVSGPSYRVLAVDGAEVNEPTMVTDRTVTVTAGGRADLEVVLPEDGSGARVEMGGSAALVLGADGSGGLSTQKPVSEVDLLSYGSPAPSLLRDGRPTRTFDYVIGHRPGFLDGRPGMWWTINGHLLPDVPMFTVNHGDLVRMRIENNSGEVHPMHLHGHHALVLSRNGVAATGSPWMVDSLNVADGDAYELAFLADNPGIWMDHCHNLPHAAQGLVAHLMYAGYTTPFLVGHSQNHPE